MKSQKLQFAAKLAIIALSFQLFIQIASPLTNFALMQFINIYPFFYILQLFYALGNLFTSGCLIYFFIVFYQSLAQEKQ